MKRLKKILAAFVAATVVSAAVMLPASAEIISTGSHAVNFTVPSGWTYSEERSEHTATRDLRKYSCDDSGDGWAWMTAYAVSKDSSEGKLNLASKEEIAKYVEKGWENQGNSVSGMQTSLDAISGKQFLVLEYVLTMPDGVVWYESEYRLSGYVFRYAATTPSKPHFDDFYGMLKSVSYAAPPSNDKIKIYVNGTEVIPDSAPVIRDDRTLVPIRAVAEALGYSVEWDGSSQTVNIKNSNQCLELIIGKTAVSLYYYNALGNIEGMDALHTDVPPQIINDRTYLPLRAVGENLGASVDWDGSTRSVYVNN